MCLLIPIILIVLFIFFPLVFFLILGFFSLSVPVVILSVVIVAIISYAISLLKKLSRKKRHDSEIDEINEEAEKFRRGEGKAFEEYQAYQKEEEAKKERDSDE